MSARVHKVTQYGAAYTWCDRLVIDVRRRVTPVDANVTCLRCLGKIGDAIRSRS